MPTRIGVDTGGTFTDLIAIDEQTGATALIKTPSTPDDPGRAIVTGIQQGIDQGLWRAADITMLVHGTTVATNALLERRGAKTGMITTAGFADVLEIQRQNRPRMYDLRSRRPQPLVPRHLRLEIDERILPDGSVELPPDEQQVLDVCRHLADGEVESVVVGLLHSHTNPQHERLVGEIVARELPSVTLCLSHQIAPQQGEFERFSTAAASAYVQPIVQTYLARLQSSLEAIGVTAPVYVMKSSGGAALADSIANKSIQTALSGPAGGVRAVTGLAESVSGGNLIGADMGGTSFDVAVVTGTQPQVASEAAVGGMPLRTAMLDIHTIGAGGGSIGWVDAGGALRVGPQSAGARPGPACYGRGGDRPTVTDANLVLGRLGAASRLAGEMPLDVAAAQFAVEKHLAEPLGMTVEAAALGMIGVVNAGMVAALRELTVERGVDPREYALCPFGGAGSLHGAELADEIGITTVVVPASPGVFSAWGLLESNLREDRFAALTGLLDASQTERVIAVSGELEQAAKQELAPASSVGALTLSARRLSLRYRGQSSDLPIDWPPNSELDTGKLSADFHNAHHVRYGFDRKDHPIEVVGLAVTAEVKLPKMKPQGKRVAAASDDPGTQREVWFSNGPTGATIYQRNQLAVGQSFSGPAVIEQIDTVTLVPPGWLARVRDDSVIEMTREQETQ